LPGILQVAVAVGSIALGVGLIGGALGARQDATDADAEELERQRRLEEAQARGREQQILSNVALEQMQPYLLALIPLSALGAAAWIARGKVKDRRLREELRREIAREEEYGY
jgi:hypothetical protein